MVKYIKEHKLNNSMNKTLFLFAFAFIIVMGLASANLGTFKENSCVSIRTLANCSVNINEVTSPTTTYKLNTSMTNLGGQTYNYTFCNTAESGTYTYSWSGSCLSCGTDNCGNNFEITPSGYHSSGTNIALFLIVCIFMYAIAFIGFFGKHEWVTIIGGMGMLALGLYTINNGIIIYQDAITKVFSWTTIGLGAFFAIFPGLELIKETLDD